AHAWILDQMRERDLAPDGCILPALLRLGDKRRVREWLDFLDRLHARPRGRRNPHPPPPPTPRGPPNPPSPRPPTGAAANHHRLAFGHRPGGTPDFRTTDHAD